MEENLASELDGPPPSAPPSGPTPTTAPPSAPTAAHEGAPLNPDDDDMDGGGRQAHRQAERSEWEVG